MPDPSSRTNSSSNFNNSCFLCSSKTLRNFTVSESTDKQTQHPSNHSIFIQLLSPTLIDHSWSSSSGVEIDYCTRCSLKLATTQQLIQQLEKLTVQVENTRKEIVRQILTNYDVCSRRLSAELEEFEDEEERVQLIQQKQMLEEIISNFKEVYKQHDDDENVQIQSQWSLSPIAVHEEPELQPPNLLFTSTGTQTMTLDLVQTPKRIPELAYVKLERLNDDQVWNSNLESLTFVQLKTEIDDIEEERLGIYTTASQESQDQYQDQDWEPDPLQEINEPPRRRKKRNLKCYHCSKAFKRAPVLEAHINSVHLKIKPYSCDLCSKSFSCAEYLTNHIVIHPEAASTQTSSVESVNPSILSFTCMNSNCGGFDGGNEAHLANHVGAEHLGLAAVDSHKPFVCLKCGKDYSRRINLRKHEVTIHGKSVTVTKRYSETTPTLQNQKKIHRKNISKTPVAVKNDQEEEEDGYEVEEKEQVLQIQPSLNSPSPVPPNPKKPKSKPKSKPKPKSKRVLQTQEITNKVKQPFKCPHCQKILSSKVMFQIHVNRHLNLKPYTCEICSRSFSSQMYFRDHRTTHPELEAQLQTLSCPDCDKTFLHAQHLLIHRAVHENVVDPKANSDVKTRRKIKTRIKREKIKGKGRLKLSILDPSACNFDGCGFKAKDGDEAELLVHVNKVHIQSIEVKQPLHICSKCGANYKTGLPLRRHQLSIHGSVTRVFTCDWVVDCHTEFPSLFKLRQHIQDEHCGDNDDGSDNDNAAGQDPAQLMKKLLPRRRRRRIHTCEECPSHPTFSSKMGLRIHMNAHSNLRPYMCEICSYSTTRIQYLRHHQTKHPQLNLKEFKCPDCHKTFSTPNYLRVHRLTIHAKEHKVTCQYCGYGTYYEATLRRHIAGVHVGEKPFECETCGVKFKHNSHLTVHRRNHTGERPYVCDICSKGFIDKKYLVRHSAIHGGVLKYECEICDKKFPVRDYLRIHMKSHNKNKLKKTEEIIAEPPTN